jgi:RNA polymerase sigma factor (sigma-70 family)
MAGRADGVWHLFGRFLGPPALAGTDEELVRAFVRRRDEAAFTELVRRHGPLVYGVCRRVLRDAHAADDAFQVTFLTLACKAASLRTGQALGAWLHRVALHVAVRARGRAQRTEATEREAARLPRTGPTADAGWQELPAVLDEELQRLPDILRGPLVLCGLEGRTHEEAARALGWPTGSLSKRLARGRELLRQRLARRGFALGAVAATAAVPEHLLAATVRAAVLRTALSAETNALFREVLRSMFRERMKRVAGLLLAFAVLAGVVGAGLFAPGRSDPPRADAPGREEPPGRPEAAREDGLVAALGVKPFAFRSPLLCVAYSPDGKLLAISEADTFHLYDAATKKELRRWDAAGGNVTALAFSPDSTLLAAGEARPKVHLWDPATGKQVREIEGSRFGSSGVMFSADGKLLATAGSEQRPGFDPRLKGPRDPGILVVRVREADTGKEAEAFRGGLVDGTCAAFSADGKSFAWGGADAKVHLCPAAGGADLFTATDPYPGGILSVDFSPDSKLLACGSMKTVRLFEVATGKEVLTFEHDPNEEGGLGPAAGRVRFAPDGKTLALGGNAAGLLDVATGKVRRMEGPRQGYSELAFRPDGKELAGGRAELSIHFWDVATGKENPAPTGHRGRVTAAAFSPDAKVVLTAGSDNTLRLWDRATGKEVRRVDDFPVRWLGALPDGTWLAAAGDLASVRLLDAGTLLERSRITPEGGNPATTVAVSRDGKLLAIGSTEIRVYELPGGKVKVKLPGHAFACYGLEFSADGKTLVSGGSEEIDPKKDPPQRSDVRLWDLATGKEVRQFEPFPVWPLTMVAYSPDGKFVLPGVLSAEPGRPAGLPVWEAGTGKEVARVEVSGLLTRMAFSPDGKVLALATDAERLKRVVRVELWDAATWQKVATLEGHTSPVDVLAFSADGKFLVTGAQDSSALVWQVPEAKK